jgi:hypothetical protein
VSRPTVGEQCDGCRRDIGRRGRFTVMTASGMVVRCLLCAAGDPALARRSSLVALIVGSILTGINHGDVLVSGSWTPALAWKVPLTYLVPFLVATWGALTNSRIPRR